MKNFLSAFYQHRWLFLFSILYMLVVAITAARLGATFSEFAFVINYFVKATLFLLFFPMFILLIWFARAFSRTIDKNPVRWLQRAMTEFDAQVMEFFQSGQLWSGVAAVFAILPINVFFCVSKSLIPHLTNYNWDPALASADKFLHFGFYPHEIISPWIEAYGLSNPINILYMLWFIVLFLLQGYCMFVDTDKLTRMRYLWCTLFCWAILGSLVALLFASVGPAFYSDYYPEKIWGVSPYASYMAGLKQTHPNLEVIILGPAMLELGRNGQIINLNALSAMPSMHVAIAFLTVLYFWGKNRVIAWFAFAYYLVILAGSVYLAWHYALDGYAATILVWIMWMATKPLVEKLNPEWTQPKAGV